MKPRDALISAIAVLAVPLVACGGAGIRRTAVPEGPPPTTIEAAQQDIDRWSAALGVTPSATSMPTVGPPTAPRPDAPTAPPSPVEASTYDSVHEEQAGAMTAACQQDCRAIASMRRAVGVLCGLSGVGDPRCVEGRRRLGECEAKVATCGC